MTAEKMRDIARALFEYIKEICHLSQQTVLDINKQIGAISLHEMCNSEHIKLYSRDAVAGAEELDSEPLLVFHKPDFTLCPSPDQTIINWLEPGWDNYRNELSHLDVMERPKVVFPDTDLELISDSDLMDNELTSEDEEALSALDDFSIDDDLTELSTVEHFEDDPERVGVYEIWSHERELWAENEKQTERVRELFNDLFDIYNQYRNSPETMEIMVGNGLLTDRTNKNIHHPVFLKRVEVRLDLQENILTVEDSMESPELYMPLFSSMENIHNAFIPELQDRIVKYDIHPLDHNEGQDILKTLTHGLDSSNQYIGEAEKTAENDERIVVQWDPYIFLRKRPDGTIKALESILSSIADGVAIPESLNGIIGNIDSFPKSGESETGDISGIDENELFDNEWTPPPETTIEDEDILLPMVANKEQVQIVQRIEKSPAVLVQGPPGTGKTHTIANLLGHFLAKGNTVLVTSQTSKALSVLKEKLPEAIQALCVSLIEEGFNDMEGSIEKINNETASQTVYSLAQKTKELGIERHLTFSALEDARRRVYRIRQKEFEPIVYEGESFSVQKAAEFVRDNESLLQLIPGSIKQFGVFPLSDEDLEWLYKSNELISAQEETELSADLPEISVLMTPQQLEAEQDVLNSLSLQLEQVNKETYFFNLHWSQNQHTVVNRLSGSIYAEAKGAEAENALSKLLNHYSDRPQWAVSAMTDGAEEGLSRKKWEQLIQAIDDAYSYASSPLLTQSAGRSVIVSRNHEYLWPSYQSFLESAQKHGSIRKSLFMSKEQKMALDAVKINGRQPESLEDIRIVLAYFKVLDHRKTLEQLWDPLLAKYGEKRISELGEDTEQRCHQIRDEIDFWVHWVRTGRAALCRQAVAAGLGEKVLEPLQETSPFNEHRAEYVLRYIDTRIVPAARILHTVNM